MRERLVHVRVLTWATVIESLRRKDLYVVWFLAVFGLLAGRALAGIGVRGVETFLRDITLNVVNLLSVVICIWLAGRQLPEEISRRTLFPLLARPVARVDVLISKLLAAWLLSALALLVLGGIAWIALALYGAPIGPIYWQYLLLRIFSFGPIAALTILLSLLMAPAPTVTLSALLTLCWTVFARNLQASVEASGGWEQAALKGLYFVLPHLDLFDLSGKAAYNWPPIPLWAVAALALYAAAYAGVFLGLGAVRFRRMTV